MLRVGYGTLYIHTERGLEYLDELSEWKYIDQYNDAGIVVFLLSMLASFVVLGMIALSTVRSPPESTAAQDPVNLVALPGVNEFLPLAAAVHILIALLIAAGVHELAHGLAMRAEDVTIEEVGIVVLLVVPIAAYVLPDEDEFESANVRGRARIFSAGVFANLIVFALATAVFLLPGTGGMVDSFLTYFGATVGGDLPTSADVTELGFFTSTLFWVWFFNINLAFVNVLPLVFLDGGHIVGLASEFFDLPVRDKIASYGIVGFTTIGTISVFLLAVFGPVLLR